ncbi:MAG: hypothetical protein ACKOZY_12550 [Flavobacteriales bacterium]
MTKLAIPLNFNYGLFGTHFIGFLDSLGQVMMSFTTTGMYRGWLKSDGTKEIKIYE